MALPNIQSWSRLIFKKNWSALDIPRHLQLFSSKTIKDFLENHGFRIHRIKYGYDTYDFIASIQLALFGKKYRPDREERIPI